MPNEIETEALIACDNCDAETKKDETIKTQEGDIICETCQRNDYNFCEDCEDYIRAENACSAYNGDRTICKNCRDNDYSYCDGCGYYVNSDDYGGEGLCQTCYDDRDTSEDDGLQTRYANTETDSYISTATSEGVTIDPLPSLRAFGLEIETIAPNRETLADLPELLPRAIGVVQDGSLTSYGIEVVTPRLAGEKGIALVKDITKTLLKNDFTINRSCGLHVHVDIADIKENTMLLRDLMRLYMAIDDVLIASIPPKRRKSTFCKPLKHGFSYEDIVHAGDIARLERLFYKETDAETLEKRKKNKYDTQRYYGVNFHSVFYRGTLEIRYHSGTNKAEKMLAWAGFHIALIDYIQKTHYRERAKTIDALSSTFALAEKLVILEKEIPMPEKARAYVINRIKNNGVCVEL